MHYRLYTSEDFDALYAIEEQCFQPPFRFSRKYMRKIIDRTNSVTWIAENDGQMGGFAVAEWEQGTGEVICYIQTIEVAPAWRKQGIAAELLRRIEDSARSADAEVIWLHVHAQNAAAIRLYETNGYLPEGREEDYYAPGHAALIYGKPLDPEPADQRA